MWPNQDSKLDVTTVMKVPSELAIRRSSDKMNVNELCHQMMISGCSTFLSWLVMTWWPPATVSNLIFSDLMLIMINSDVMLDTIWLEGTRSQAAATLLECRLSWCILFANPSQLSFVCQVASPKLAKPLVEITKTKLRKTRAGIQKQSMAEVAVVGTNQCIFINTVIWM